MVSCLTALFSTAILLVLLLTPGHHFYLLIFHSIQIKGHSQRSRPTSRKEPLLRNNERLRTGRTPRVQPGAGSRRLHRRETLRRRRKRFVIGCTAAERSINITSGHRLKRDIVHSTAVPPNNLRNHSRTHSRTHHAFLRSTCCCRSIPLSKYSPLLSQS